MNYADVSELDDRANKLRVLWRKTINFAASFDSEFQELEARFASGVYGPEWTFSRWLIVKCGLSQRTSYRVIQALHRVVAEDRKEQLREAIERERKEKALITTERKATQLAWDSWRREEGERIRLVQLAWDQWRASERDRVREEKRQATTERERVREEKQRAAGERKRIKVEAQQAKEQQRGRSANAMRQARFRAKQTPLRNAGNGGTGEIQSTCAKSGTATWESKLADLLNSLRAVLLEFPLDRQPIIVNAIIDMLQAFDGQSDLMSPKMPPSLVTGPKSSESREA